MKKLFFAFALALAAETPQPETIKPSPELLKRLADLEIEQKAINSETQAILARQRAVTAQAEEIRSKACWEAGITPAECGQWQGQQIIKIPKQEAKK